MSRILGAALLAAATGFSLPAFADDLRLLTVAGQGTVSATPDAVTINAGVVSSAKTAREALGQNSQTMTAVFAALKKLGVPDKAVRTTNLNLSPQYAPAPSGSIVFPGDRPITGYRVTNTVNVTLDDVRNAGAVLDALVAAGANQASGINYSVKNDQDLLTQARAQAVQNAIDRAHTYAAAAGVTLGTIHSISDTGPVSAIFGFEAPALAANSPPPPLGVGQQTLRANVTVSWEIK
jgi:uncharacterized protein YggE